ncbi:MAG TPA: flippase [Terriglobales bacterium]
MSAATNIPTVATAAPPPAAPATEFRRRVGSISRQSTVYFGGTLLTAAAGYFFKIYLARTLGAEALGLYALGMSIVGAVGLFNAFGLPTAATRFIAEYSGRRDYARLGGFLKGGLCLLSAANLLVALALLRIGPWLGSRFYRAPGLGRYFVFFAPILLFAVLRNFLEKSMAGYQGVARRTVVTNLIGTPINILFAVILISLGFGLAGYLAAQVASGLLILAMLGFSVWRLTPVSARSAPVSWQLDRTVVSFSAVALGLAIVHFVLTQADKIILGFYLDPAQVGIYAIAMAMVGFIPIALQSVNQIFSPMIAELHASRSHELLRRLYKSLTKWVLILTLPLALTAMMFSRPLMGVFGRGFQGGAAVLAIGAVGQIFNCGVGSVGFLLLMSGYEKKLIPIQAANAGLVIAVSIMLVPRLGITGAAIAATSAVIITNLWALAVVVRTLKLFPYDAAHLRLIVPTALCGLALFGLRRALLPWHSGWRAGILALIASYAAFFASLWMVGLDGEDRKIARIVWNKISFQSQRIGMGLS